MDSSCFEELSHAEYHHQKQQSRELTNRRTKEILHLKSLGYCQIDIGRILNVSQSVVSRAVLYPKPKVETLKCDLDHAGKRRRRQELTMPQKLEICKLSSEGFTQREICQIFRVDLYIVARVLRDKRQVVHESLSSICYERNRRRFGFYVSVEEAMVEWFQYARRYNVPVSLQTLSNKAQRFAELLGFDNYEPQNGWYIRWKERNCVVFKDELKKPVRKNVSYVNFSPQNTYCISETGVQINPDSVASQEKSLTILACCNQTGSDKRPLLVIGSNLPPAVCCLPCHYEMCYRSWITSDLFVEWLLKFDAAMKWAVRRIVLILDSSPVHPAEVQCDLKNISLCFVKRPSNPFTQGISQTLQSSYNDDFRQKKQLQFPSCPTLLDSLHMVNKAWQTLAPETIQNCFWSAGFTENRFKPPIISGMSSSSVNNSCTDWEAGCHGMISDVRICKPISTKNEEDIDYSSDCDQDVVIEPEEDLSPAEICAVLSTIRDYIETDEVVDYTAMMAVEDKIGVDPFS